ncbi:unnamed protein product [Closterium sp. NIES-65]|nr:unnamed protein product [Closterium sp. NIES-65]
MEEAIIADTYGLRLKNEFDRDLSFRLVNAHVSTYLAICPWEHKMVHQEEFMLLLRLLTLIWRKNFLTWAHGHGAVQSIVP